MYGLNRPREKELNNKDIPLPHFLYLCQFVIQSNDSC